MNRIIQRGDRVTTQDSNLGHTSDDKTLTDRCTSVLVLSEIRGKTIIDVKDEGQEQDVSTKHLSSLVDFVHLSPL